MNFLKLNVLALIFISLLLGACGSDSETPTPVEIGILNFEISLDENPSNGQVIGTPSASASSGTLSFALSNQNPAGALAINATTGELTVADASLFDYETRTSITATVTASVGSTSRTATVTINLNDVYDSGVAFGAVIEHWRFDGNFAGAVDATRVLQQGSTTATVSANATDRFGNANRALTIGTDGGFLSIGNMSLVSGNGARAASFWVKKPTNGTGFMEIFDYRDGTSTEIFSFLYAQEDANYYGFRRNTSGAGLSYNTVMPTNEWQHVVINYSPTSATLYLNGTEVRTAIFSTPGLNTPANATLKVGAGFDTGFLLGFALDDLIFYNRALTEVEITELSDN